MYLSRIRLDTDKRSTQLALVSPSKIHGAVENCFEKKEERKLWRIDRLNAGYYLLILSPCRPDLRKIKSQYGYPGDEDEIKSYDPLLVRVKNGTIWQFRLTANPVHSVKEGKGRGKIVAHVSEKYQMEWLEKRAGQNGFTILSEGSCVTGSEWKIFYKNKGGKRVRLKEATFEGILKVEDQELFKKALVDGIGLGKAYGMGLLTIMSF